MFCFPGVEHVLGCVCVATKVSGRGRMAKEPGALKVSLQKLVAPLAVASWECRTCNMGVACEAPLLPAAIPPTAVHL
jgi:hypothetical protein